MQYKRKQNRYEKNVGGIHRYFRLEILKSNSPTKNHLMSKMEDRHFLETIRQFNLETIKTIF